jgi:hypothetical protein
METVNLVIGISALIIAIVSAFYSYHLSKKQLNFAVIISCTERFQKIMAQLKLNVKDEERIQIIKLYIDLCNEELFYFKNKYLPDEIIDEWIDGMIYYLPHYNSDGRNLNENESCLLEIIENNLLHDYPRIKESFKVHKEFNLSKYEDKKELIKIVKANLKRTKSYT